LGEGRYNFQFPFSHVWEKGLGDEEGYQGFCTFGMLPYEELAYPSISTWEISRFPTSSKKSGI
jgi:hypothetical protein